MKTSKILLGITVIVGALVASMAFTAPQSGSVPFNALPAPTFDSGWVVAEPDQSGALFPIAHPIGSDVASALIAAEIRFPGSAEFSMNTWTANDSEVKVGRALFSPREVRVRIWVTR